MQTGVCMGRYEFVRLISLDLVRFFAAMSVVLYHYTSRAESNTFEYFSEISKFGYLGVPLFFIISGYVISLSASNRTAFEFAISRFVRLYPAFWVSIAFTVLVSVFLSGESKYSLVQVLANLTMLNDYLGYPNIDDIYWTLQAEIKFYACIFLLVLFNVFDKTKIWLSIWILITALHLITSQPFFMGWFISPYYSSFFIAGVAFYLIHKEGFNAYNIFVLISSLLLSVFRGFEQVSGFIIEPSIIDKYIAVFIICVFYGIFYLLVSEKLKLVKRKIYLYLGGITYPLYLIHNEVGKLMIDNTFSFLPDELSVILVITIMLICSLVIHVGFERKIANPMKVWLLSALKYFDIVFNS